MKKETISNLLCIYKEIGIDLFMDRETNIFKNKENHQINQKFEEKSKSYVTKKFKEDNQIFNNIKNVDEIGKKFKNLEYFSLKKTATNFVPPQGDGKSNILIVDGIPNTDEDRVGKSFVGEKGNLFKKMLNAINLKTEDVFILTGIPWRPPGNRYPTKSEIEICTPYVFETIKILEPKIILCLGEIPANMVLNIEQSILKLRGKWYNINLNENYSKTLEVLPTLGISYLLNRPDMKRLAWEDMKLLRDKIKNI